MKKNNFLRKINTQIIVLLCLFSAFFITALLYRHFTVTLAADTIIITRLVNIRIYQFVCEVLAVFFICLIFIILYSFWSFYQQISTRNQLALALTKYSVALDTFSGSLWEYDLTTDTLRKSTHSVGLFEGRTEITDFRDTFFHSVSLNPEDHESLLHFFDQMLSRDSSLLTTQFRASEADGEEAWYELTANKVFNEHGIPVSVIGQTVNITHLRQREVIQREIESQDKLTKLNNAETTRSIIDHYLSTVKHSVISAMIIIDLDNFFEISRILGSSFCDAILLDLSAKLKKLFQAHDIIGRIGNDSFLIFMTDAPSLSYIEERAEDICMLVHDIYAGSSNDMCVTASVGVSVFPTDGNSFEVLSEKACLALWHAKQSGKDCFFLYSDELNGGETSYATDFFNEDIASTDSASYESHSLINTSLVMNAIDILFNTQDNDDSVQMLLSLIGIYYDLDRISIIEYFDNPTVFSITYEWASHSQYQLKDSIQRVPFQQDKYYARYRDCENGVFHSDKYLFNYTEDMLIDLMPDRKPCACFQCGFLDHGSYIGYIAAYNNENPHTWTQNEIDSLTLISKIIGSYIIRQRSIRYANWITKADQLTGAYNFNTFLSEVNKLHSEKQNLSLAMIYSDVRQFKLINDNYGYQAGDAVLKSITDIYHLLFPSGILCRISGDKFVICVRYSDEESLASKARMLISSCRQLSSPEGQPYHIGLILGIYPMTEKDTAIMAVDRANIARKSAQRHESAGYAFFTSTMRSSLILQKDLETAMEDSILENNFLLYFQPKYDLCTKELCGAEALVRWQHPTLGFLYPNSFIPLFESNGFIIDLDYYMFEQVCAFIRDQRKLGHKMFPISVNFSREHFKADGLPEKLKAAVEFYDIPPELIEIEITESAFAAVDNYFTSLLERIRSYGFRLAMDDFGSGLSSLNLLCDLPFNIIKIDKDFFHSKTTTNRERIVISSIVEMAHNLNMEVICEGVETVEQADFLNSINCNMAQGYLYSKPISKQEFVEKYF